MAHREQNHERPLPRAVRTAIIGGGVAGLYAAFRLSPHNNVNDEHPSAAVFEATSRFGGRLCSTAPAPGDPVVDLGGMRFLRSHRLLTSLVENVLTLDESNTAAQPVPFAKSDADSIVYYLRGRTFTLRDVQQHQIPQPQRHPPGNTGVAETAHRKALDGGPHMSAFHLPEQWRGMGPDEVLAAIIEEVLAADGVSRATFVEAAAAYGTAHEAWARVKRTLRYRFAGPYIGTPLHHMTLGQVVLDRAGACVAQYISEGLGYDCTLEWGTADGFETYLDEFTTQMPAFALKGGMEALCDGLRSRASAFGTPLFTQTRLEDIRHARGDDSRNAGGDDGGGDVPQGFRYILRFWDALAGRHVSVAAEDVVLALPRLALEHLQPSMAQLGGVAAGQSFARDVRRVDHIGAVKISMWFDTPWLEHAYGRNACVVSDLPIRQSLLFGAETSDRRSVVIATYCDSGSAKFWKKVQQLGCAQDQELRERQLWENGETAEKEKRIRREEESGGVQAASAAVVEEAMRQLELVFGELVRGFTPTAALFKAWDGEHEADGMAYHYWEAGTRVWDVTERMRQPLPDERVFVCGEAYSDRHGWVEGALCTTECVLKKNLTSCVLVGCQWRGGRTSFWAGKRIFKVP